MHTVIQDREVSKTGLLLPSTDARRSCGFAGAFFGRVQLERRSKDWREFDLLVFGSKRAQGRHANRGDEVHSGQRQSGRVLDTELVRTCFGQCWMVVEA